MRADRKETLRYLGYRGQEMDEQTARMIGEVSEELERSCTPKSIYREYACEVSGNCVRLGELEVASRNLAVNLKGCRSAVVLAATIGRAADFMIRRYSVSNMAKAAVVQAAGASCIESYVDEVQEQIRESANARGLYLRPRFSPGYGDFALEYQRDIFAMLECGKRIGLTLTEGNLMMPSKSVTAVIGLTAEVTPPRSASAADRREALIEMPRICFPPKERESCQMQTCSLCVKTDCEFRVDDSRKK